MAEKKFHVFYTWAYGIEHKREVFEEHQLPAVLELVKKAAEPNSSYYNFAVVFGELLEFEPHEKVLAYRIKETDDG